VECFAKDKDDLFAFYDFPAMHRIHLPTTNPIESTFTTVYKLCREAGQSWRKLGEFKYIPLVETGIKLVNGKRADEEAA
jgi:putative transposase